MTRLLLSTALLGLCAPALAQSEVMGLEAPELGAPDGVIDLESEGDQVVPWTSEQASTHIWQGEATTDFEFVVDLSVVDRRGNVFNFCSGVVIAPRVVATAAHCVEALDAEYRSLDYAVVFDPNPGRQLESYVWGEDHVRNDGYNPRGRDISDDIGLIFLAEDAPVNPVVLSDVNPNEYVGTSLTFVGYGVENDAMQGGGYRQRTEIPFKGCVTPDWDFPEGRRWDCDASEGYSPEFLYSSHRESNVCSGDSGGGVFRYANERWELVGINSYVTPSCSGDYGNAYQVPGTGSARVDFYLPWIQQRVSAVVLSSDPIEVEGGGCATVPGSPAVLWVLPVLPLVLRRRRP